MKDAVKALKHKQAVQRAAEKKPAAPRGPNWAMLIVVAVFTAVVTYGLFEYVILCKLPTSLLGQWEVTSNGSTVYPAGTTMQFSRAGTVIVKHPNGQELVGAARVEHDLLYFMMPDPSERSWDMVTSSRLLLALTDTHMELEETDGTTMKLDRQSILLK